MEVALQRQIAHLRRSATAYDEGSIEEAERLASAVYMICHDGGRNAKSLLGQLDLKSRVRFPDSSSWPPKEPGVARAGPPLLGLWNDDQGLRYAPRLGSPARLEKLPFSKWWDQKVYENARGLTLSRKNLVCSLRSQDGGGHVDDKLTDEAYYSFLAYGDHHGWNDERTLSVDSGIPVQNAHWMTMRQIAWEVDQALIASGF
jgi:hypothetical protein